MIVTMIYQPLGHPSRSNSNKYNVGKVEFSVTSGFSYQMVSI